eukprot:scpid48937/ scgid35531/ Protein sine oculis
MESQTSPCSLDNDPVNASPSEGEGEIRREAEFDQPCPSSGSEIIPEETTVPGSSFNADDFLTRLIRTSTNADESERSSSSGDIVDDRFAIASEGRTTADLAIQWRLLQQVCAELKTSGRHVEDIEALARRLKERDDIDQDGRMAAIISAELALDRSDIEAVVNICEKLEAATLQDEEGFNKMLNDRLCCLWEAAHYQAERERLGRPLSALARFRSRKRYPVPATISPEKRSLAKTLPPTATTFLKDWYRKNRTANIYPTLIQKKYLAKKTGLTLNQVKTWLANARRRSAPANKLAVNEPHVSTISPHSFRYSPTLLSGVYQPISSTRLETRPQPVQVQSGQPTVLFHPQPNPNLTLTTPAVFYPATKRSWPVVTQSSLGTDQPHPIHTGSGSSVTDYGMRARRSPIVFRPAETEEYRPPLYTAEPNLFMRCEKPASEFALPPPPLPPSVHPAAAQSSVSVQDDTAVGVRVPSRPVSASNPGAVLYQYMHSQQLKQHQYHLGCSSTVTPTVPTTHLPAAMEPTPALDYNTQPQHCLAMSFRVMPPAEEKQYCPEPYPIVTTSSLYVPDPYSPTAGPATPAPALTTPRTPVLSHEVSAVANTVNSPSSMNASSFNSPTSIHSARLPMRPLVSDRQDLYEGSSPYPITMQAESPNPGCSPCKDCVTGRQPDSAACRRLFVTEQNRSRQGISPADCPGDCPGNWLQGNFLPSSSA